MRLLTLFLMCPFRSKFFKTERGNFRGLAKAYNLSTNIKRAHMVVCLGPLCKAKGDLDRKLVCADMLKYPNKIGY